MRLYLHKIILNNFMSFDHAELDLDNSGISIVTGRNLRTEDNALSNGSGKSSLFNGIFYALTGETSNGLKNNLENIYSDPNDCWVELHFNCDSNYFVVRRIKTPRTDLKIWMNDKDISGKGIKESTDVLNQYLDGITPMFLGSTVILGQGLPYRFSDNNPGMRKYILEQLTQSDNMVQFVREKLDLRQSILQGLLRSTEDDVLKFTTENEMNRRKLKDNSNKLVEIEAVTSEGSLDDIIESIKLNINELNSDKANAKSFVKRMSSEVSNLYESKNESNDEKFKKLSLLDNDKNKMVLSTTDKLRLAETHYKQLTEYIETIKNSPGVCPTCGQPIKSKLDIDKHIEERNKYLNDAQSCRAELKEINSQYNQCKATLTEKYDKNIKSFTEEITRYNLLIDGANSDINKIEESLKDLNSKLTKYSILKSSKDDLVNDNNRLNKLIADYDLTIKDKNAQLEDIKNRLSVIQHLITLSKKEFRSALLEGIIQYLDKRVKYYSNIIYNNELLSIKANSNAIDITFDSKYYEALSGGEKQKVDIIIQLAIRDLLSKQFDIKSNLLIVDEILDSLDSVGSQKILDLITSLGDISTIFIVSHHGDELGISYDSRIVVEKGKDGISTLKEI